VQFHKKDAKNRAIYEEFVNLSVLFDRTDKIR